VGVDYYTEHINDGPEIYTFLFLLGALSGFFGVTVLMRTPEPAMAPADQQHILQVLREPFADRNFRKLLLFLGSWNFADNIATPFGVVYMLERLDMSLTAVLMLVVFGQVIHVIFLRIWGRLSDRYSNKSVLTISGPLFMLSLLVWPFTTMPEAYSLTMPLLIFAHALGGMSTAGVALASSNIALKTAPYGRATAYLAVNALVCGMAMTISPILAGIAADYLVQRELSLTLQFSDLAAQNAEFSMVALNLRGLDFLFVSAALLGLYAIHRLLVVQEEGEVQESVVVEELWNEVRKFGRSVSTIPGLRHFSHFPYYVLSAVGQNRKRGPELRSEEHPKPTNPFRAPD
jgi:MFS family permease